MGDWLKTSIKAKRESWGNRGDYCTAATITRASKGKKERRGWGNSNLEVWRKAWKSWGSVQAYEERVVPGCSCSPELKEGTPWCWASDFWEGGTTGRLESSKEPMELGLILRRGKVLPGCCWYPWGVQWVWLWWSKKKMETENNCCLYQLLLPGQRAAAEMTLAVWSKSLLPLLFPAPSSPLSPAPPPPHVEGT